MTKNNRRQNEGRIEPLISKQNGFTNGDAVYNPPNGIPADDNEMPQENIKPIAFIDLFRFGDRCDKIRVLLGIIFGIFAGTAIVLPFFFSARLANALMLKQNDTQSDELIDIGIFYISIDLGFGLVIFISVFLQYYLLKVACANIVANLRKEFMKSLLKQDAAWLSEQKFGAISAQLTENINTIREGIGEKLGSVIRGVSSFFAAITLSFIADWQLACIPLITGPMAVGMALIMTKLVNDAESKQQDSLEKGGAVLQETIMNVTTVQCCNGEDQMENKYRKILKKARAFAVRTYVWTGLFEGLTFCVLYFFFAADFCVGALMYFNGTIKQPGEVFIVPNTFFNGAWTLGTVSPYFIAIQKARIAAAHIYAKIDRKPISDATGDEEIKDGGEIEFKNVHFSYQKRPNVLNGLSFKAAAGKTTALVSHSGGGKSTCVELIVRSYACNKGDVLVDGTNIRSLNPQKLRRLIGIVRQEPALFSETIAENIRLGDKTITDEMIVEACKVANANNFIQRFEEKYQTKIGPGQLQLSGGQKQRLAIARAIVHNPPILILDEATSALDADSEAIVQAALRKAASGRTTIVIAHRLSTLSDFVDKIVVIDGGKVIEEGTHHELTAQENGFYAKLVQAQQIDGVLDLGPSSSMVEPKTINEIVQKPHVHFPEENPQHKHVPLSRTPSLETPRSRANSAQFTFLSIADGFIYARTRFPDSPKIVEHLETSKLIENSETSNHIEDSETLKQKNGLLLLYTNCRGNYCKLVTAVVVSALVGLELFFLVLLQGYMFDTMSGMSQSNWLGYRNAVITFTSCAVALGIFCFATIAGSYIFYGWSAERIVDKLKVRALSSILKKDAAYFDQPGKHKPQLISNISTNAPALKPALDNRMVHVVSNASSIITLLVLAFIINWQIASVGTAIVSIMAAVAILANRKMQSLTDKLTNIDESAKHSVEIIENVRTIQLLCREQYFVTKFAKHLETVRKIAIKAAWYESFMFAVAMSLPFVSDATCYGLGLYLIHAGKASTSTVFLAATTVSFISWAIQFSSTSSAEFMKAKPAAEALFSIIDKKKEVKQHEERKRSGSNRNVDGKVEINQLQFAYPSRPDCLIAKGIDLQADAGKSIAIVGPSGSGKSTIIQLLERLYTPKSGKMQIDNTHIHDYNLQHLRNEMALVGQEPILLSGTIKESITLGVPHVSDSEIRQACEIADAADFINELPEKYNTEVGEKGTQLSGGQKQRLALARAIVRNPKILLLDEATSALDGESERAVQKALAKASSDRTSITIAHRLSTIQNADKIYFIDNGEVVESGTHAELKNKKNGEYAKLIRKQMLSN